MKHVFDDPEFDDEEEEARYGIAGWIVCSAIALAGVVIVVLCCR